MLESSQQQPRLKLNGDFSPGGELRLIDGALASLGQPDDNFGQPDNNVWLQFSLIAIGRIEQYC